MSEKHQPANNGNFTYCPYCSDELKVYVNKEKEITGLKYCFDCGRGFGVYGGSSYGTIGTYEMTEMQGVPPRFEKIIDKHNHMVNETISEL